MDQRMGNIKILARLGDMISVAGEEAQSAFLVVAFE